MCATNLINIVLTAAIVGFTCLTWWATRTYAKMTALSLLIQQVKCVVTEADSGNRKADIEAIKLIKGNFPDLYERIKVALSAETQERIEKS